MKRSADSNDNITTRNLSSRTTQSTIRQEQERKAIAELQLVRALALMSTPLLRALPVVLLSGYLYQYDCMTAASSCQDWYHVWKEVEDRLPDDARVHHFVDCRTDLVDLYWDHTEARGLTEALQSPHFVRQVFDKVNALKVAAKPTPGARAKAKAALPVWGVDVQATLVIFRRPNWLNPGGLCIRYGKKKNVIVSENGQNFSWGGRNTLVLKLFPNFIVCSSLRNRTVFDEQPIWP